MGLVVHIDGAKYFADVGWGENKVPSPTLYRTKKRTTNKKTTSSGRPPSVIVGAEHKGGATERPLLAQGDSAG